MEEAGASETGFQPPEQEIYFPDEDWKWTLMFDNINPAFPVELFIQIMERESVANGFTSERSCANALKHVSDRDFDFGKAAEEERDKFSYEEPRTLPWKRRFMRQSAGPQGHVGADESRPPRLLREEGGRVRR